MILFHTTKTWKAVENNKCQCEAPEEAIANERDHVGEEVKTIVKLPERIRKQVSEFPTCLIVKPPKRKQERSGPTFGLKYQSWNSDCHRVNKRKGYPIQNHSASCSLFGCDVQGIRPNALFAPLSFH